MLDGIFLKQIVIRILRAIFTTSVALGLPRCAGKFSAPQLFLDIGVQKSVG
jgi:hypothetical protein